MKKSGFTLIELLLGLILFSIIGLSLYSVFASGIRVSRMSNEDVEGYRQARWALDIMAKDLENMAAFDFSGIDEERQAFLAESGKISFPLVIDNELKHVTYYLEDLSSGDVQKTLIGNTYSKNVNMNFDDKFYDDVSFLIREEKDFLKFVAGESDEVEKEVIATDIKRRSLKFMFGFAKGEETITYDWEDEWEQAEIPANVRIEMAILIKDGDESQELNVFKNVFIPKGSFGEEEK